MTTRVLLTGASGVLGRMMLPHLAAAGYDLVATDIAPFPDVPPNSVPFHQADLGDRDAVLRIADGATAIVHFGGIANDGYDMETILNANLRGLAHVFEAAKAYGARVVFASSNHTIGFHERGVMLDEDCAYRPDGWYGASKAYGELVARLFFDKHGVESASLRIGSCLPAPTEPRHLSTWLSYPDLVRLVRACLETPDLGCRAVWGCSNNTRRWWRSKSWAEIGYEPQDDAETFLDRIPPTRFDPVTERYQGGTFTSDGYTRKG